jgi:aquaporin Z
MSGGSMRKYVAELIGTFVLVFCGIGSAVLAGEKIGYLGISLAFGLGLLTMVYTIGPVSGCHINPAVTLGAWLTKKISGREATAYVIAQVVGGICGAVLVLLIANGAATGYDLSTAGLAANGYGAHSPGQYSMGAAFVAETVLTMFLVLTVLGSTDARAPVGFAGLAIGLVLTLTNIVGIPVTNASINPARSIGPAVLAGGWAMQQLWLFIVAPLLGAVAAAGVHRGIWTPARAIETKVAETALPSEQAERPIRPAA